MTKANQEPTWLPVDHASALASRALEAVGVDPEHARMQVGLLIYAELSGHPSHGLLRLPRIVARIGRGLLDPGSEGYGEWLGSAFYAVDGRQGLGPVVARRALDAVMDRAVGTGVAATAISANNHLGMLAWYVEHVARQGFACLGLTTSEALVHPFGGRRRLIGTNPIAVGVPAEPEPFVLDMATSAISMGKVHAHELRGEPLEPGWALDSNGTPTLDPTAARTGAIAPFGGAKGYGLGLAFELLVASLTGSALGTAVTGTLDAVDPATKGDLFIVFNRRTSPTYLSEYLHEVRASGDDNPVLIPGDRARLRREQARATGIEVPPLLLAELQALSTHGGTDE